MINTRMGRRRLVLATLVAAATTALTRRSSQAVHVAWEAYLQGGTCAAPDPDARIRLGDPTYGVPVGVSGTPVGTPPIRFQSVGPDPVVPVVTSTASVDTALSDLLDDSHSIVIESIDLEDDTRTSIACGNVGGVLTDNEVVFGLRSQLADTSGVAWLHGNPDGTTTITLFVTQGLSGDVAGPVHTSVPGAPTAAAPETPASGPPAAAEVSIGSYDIYFDPSEVTIPANADVTVILPNNGMILHNFSITDHKNPDVANLEIDVDLPVGATESITINAPVGDYYFFCNVPGHEAAGMFGTLRVV